ncbi:MAG: acyl-CoA thioesterase [Azoarcus sp.]|nr:acyl-CoA thioesterase [Azoarcus sp.]
MRNPQSPWRNSVELQIPFHDLDPLEICWHGHYVRYFEIARAAFLQTIDYDYPDMRISGYAWPVIELFIRYAHPLRYRQRIEIETLLTEWENRLRFDYLVRDVASGKRLTRAYTVQVAVDMRTQEMCLASPAILAEKLGIKAGN